MEEILFSYRPLHPEDRPGSRRECCEGTANLCGRALASGETDVKWETIASENGYRRMRVEADWSSIADDYEYIVSENEKARVPGFRLGKVPRPVIEQRLQKQ